MIRLALLFCLIAAPAQAAEMAFYMKNHTGAGVVVELVSRDSDHVWPGGDRMYFLDAGQKISVPIECRAGETICYGAWIDGDAATHWGLGPDRVLPSVCEYCCSVCRAGATAVVSINP
ncbi:MAG: hypothetical protein WDZ83_08710 [Rhizobiaceae bacterium]